MKMISYLKERARPAFVIFLLAFLIRALHLLASKQILSYEMRLNDGMFFDALATALVQGTHNSAQPVVGLSPVYVGFLFFFQKLFGHELLWPRLAQIILGSLACVGLQQITRNLFGNRAGWIAGFLSAFCGIFIYFDMILIKSSLVNFSLIFFIWFFQQSLSSPVRVAAAGAFYMTAAMLRMQIIITLPWIIWVWIRTAWQKRSLRHGLCLILFFAVMFGVQFAFGAWFKSAMIHTQGVPKAEEVAGPQSGIHFYLGNHSNANGTYKRVSGIRPSAVGHVVDARNIAERELRHSLTASEVNAFWTKSAFSAIREIPVRWVILEAKKFFLIWNAYEIPNSQNYEYWRRLSWVLCLPLVSYGWLAPLALVGWIRLRKDERMMVRFLKGFAASYILSLLLFFVTADYRLPLHPIWIIFAAFTLDAVWSDIEHQRLETLRKSILLFMLFFLFCNMETYLNRYNYEISMRQRVEAVLHPSKKISGNTPVTAIKAGSNDQVSAG